MHLHLYFPFSIKKNAENNKEIDYKIQFKCGKATRPDTLYKIDNKYSSFFQFIST